MLFRRVKLPQTQEAFDKLTDDVLLSQGFDLTPEYRKLFAAFIQHAPEHDDTFDPKIIAKKIRKQKANELAFYVMYPEKRPVKVEDDTKVSSPAS